jgi:hypothetical protein
MILWSSSAVADNFKEGMMASGAGTLNRSEADSGMRAAIRRPALKLQSDERLASLGPEGFDTIADRYRKPLTKHAAGIVGAERADAIVEQAIRQARGLVGQDARANEPGPWLYWMTHNLAIADHNRSLNANGSGSANGAVAGVAVTGAAVNGPNGAQAAHANGTNGAANGSANGASNGSTNGSRAGTLTFTEGAQQFTHDSATQKLVKGPRVRVRNGVGQLVPVPLLRETDTKTQTGGGKPSGTQTGTAASPRNRKTALIFFGLCTLAVIAAFAFDRINNVDANEIKVAAGVSAGQLPNTIPPQGTSTVPGVPPTDQAPGQAPPVGTTPGLNGSSPTTPPPASGTSTTPGAPTTAPPASGTSTTPGAPTTPGATPSTTTTPATPGAPASTTGTQQGFAGLLNLFGLNTTSSSGTPVNPLLSVLGFFGLANSPGATPPKTPKPARPKAIKPAPISAPTATPTPIPTPTVTPVKPRPTPLGNAGPTITYTAAKGQENDISVARKSGRFKISDSGAATLPINSGCRSTGAKSEICKVSGVSRFDFNLGDKDDVMDLNKVGTPVTIAGGKGDDTITGGKGSDTLDGGNGSDRLEGANGADTLTGGKGDDSLEGGKGSDVLNGEAGNDSITGGAGTDSVEAGDGDDSIDVRDGKADRVNCGSGSDSVVADAADVVASDCETVSKP